MTSSSSFKCRRTLIKFVWTCSRNGAFDGPSPKRDSFPNKVKAAARTASLSWKLRRRISDVYQNYDYISWRDWDQNETESHRKIYLRLENLRSTHHWKSYMAGKMGLSYRSGLPVVSRNIVFFSIYYMTVSQGLGTTECTNLIGWNRYWKRSKFSHLDR